MASGYCVDTSCWLLLLVPVASLGLVSPGAATDGGVTFFLEKILRPFSVIASESGDLFYLSSPHHSHLLI